MIKSIKLQNEALKELNEPSRKEILEAVLDLTSTGSWVEYHRIIENKHFLLQTDVADSIFTKALADATQQGYDKIVQSLGQHRAILDRCKEAGVTSAVLDINSSEPLANATGLPLFILLTELSQHFQDNEELVTRIDLLNKAIALLDRDKGPGLWASLQTELARCIEQSTDGNRADNEEEAINHYHQALEVWSLTETPEQWWNTHFSLSNLYRTRTNGNRADNKEKGIYHVQQALMVVTADTSPEVCAMLKYNLGNDYSQRLIGNRIENNEAAISSYEQALTINKFPSSADGAGIHNNLAIAYLRRARGKSINNTELAIDHFHKALDVYTQEAFPEKWAMIQNNLGIAYIERDVGSPEENVEQAILHLNNALEFYNRELFPEDWAMAHSNLGKAYIHRTKGDRRETLKLGVAHCHLALQIRTKEAFPEECAKTHMHLVRAFLDRRMQGNRENNIEQAIAHIKSNLEATKRDLFPELWADCRIELAKALRLRIQGTRKSNLEEAISQLQEPIETTHHAFPPRWAEVQRELGILYLVRIEGNHAQNVEQAIECFQNALRVFSRNDFPEAWATIQHNLGDAYRDRILGDHANNLEEGILYCKRALEVRIKQDLPEEWAQTQNLLALLYRERAHGKRVENLEIGINCLNEALQVRTREASPEDWAETQNNLGSAFRLRIAGNRSENLERAIQHHELALEIFVRDSFPDGWANTHLKLASVYRVRIQGEIADNIEKGIHHFQKALEIYTREAFPVNWALAQNNVGNAYRERISGDHAENVEISITHLQQALQVRTREAYPEDWAMTQSNLANAYSSRVLGERYDNLEHAIEHQKNALIVYTREGFPDEWAQSTSNLATISTLRIVGSHPENLEVAINHYQQSLEVYTRDAFPEKWSGVQHNLANTYYDRICGNHADNIEIAITLYSAALEVRTATAFPFLHLQTQRSLGDLFFDEGRWQESYEAYVAAIDAGNDLLTSAYSEAGRRTEIARTTRLFGRAAYCLIQMDKLGESLVMLERGKTRSLAEALALAGLDTKDLPKQLQSSLKKARQELRQLESAMRLSPSLSADRDMVERLRTQRANLTAVIREIRQKIPAFMPTELSLDEILEVIPEHGVLVAPLITSKGSIIFVVPHGATQVVSAHTISLPEFEEGDLTSLLIGTREEHGWLQARSSEVEGTTQRLWESLIAPIHHHLSETNAKHLLILPSSGLQLLPLHAAWRHNKEGQKRALLDDYEVTYAPSAYSMSTARQRAKERTGMTALVVGINAYEHSPLINAVPEAIAIANIFGTAPVLDLDATKSAVKMAAPGSAFLHFSCHGSFNWNTPTTSAIYLAHGEPLTLSEVISELDLASARLVTLSACETGISDIRISPDEYLGLPAAFLQAGSAGVLCSLWIVDDRSTALLMERFYLNLIKGGLTASAALRESQIWLRNACVQELGDYYKSLKRMDADEASAAFLELSLGRKLSDLPYADPVYWAAFTLYGVGV